MFEKISVSMQLYQNLTLSLEFFKDFSDFLGETIS